jgi:phosphoribosylanthranilate isomerase
MTRVKICGIRTLQQADAALGAGADYLGFIFYRPSHRYVEPGLVGEIVAACRERHGGSRTLAGRRRVRRRACGDGDRRGRVGRARPRPALRRRGPAFAERVGTPVVRVVHVERTARSPPRRSGRHGAQRLLLDTKLDGRFGGTGTTYAWDAVRDVAATSFLAGGLTPDNVGEAVRAARPWAVDVSSGVERTS